MTSAARRKASCRECEEAVDHCHGTVMLHSDGSVECTEVHCSDLSEFRHIYVLTCTVVINECRCREGNPLLH